MTERARRGTKHVVVEMELMKEEYIERSENEAFSELSQRVDDLRRRHRRVSAGVSYDYPPDPRRDDASSRDVARERARLPFVPKMAEINSVFETGGRNCLLGLVCRGQAAMTCQWCVV
jgi:hypothetical protein